MCLNIFSAFRAPELSTRAGSLCEGAGGWELHGHDVEDAQAQLVEVLDAVCVHSVGNTFVLYRCATCRVS